MRSSGSDVVGAAATRAPGDRNIRLGSRMIPLIDSTKTTGLILVGMLLAGAAPFDAVRLQLVLLYVLLGSVAIASLTAVALSHRRFFASAHQARARC
jgi:putative ABC transport system permease protein